MSLLNQNKESDAGNRSLRKTKSSKDVVDFTKVGGLSHHLKTLREVIIFPLLHGNVFSYFKIKAPRGVLFHGPPGTGKTLVAGALAAEINKEDGLAPIRSEKNDHIHSSIVATLLALMDGLDNKPGVIVIGATNRIESIDPALRRPGRFDKELYFPLPGVEARKEIIQRKRVKVVFKIVELVVAVVETLEHIYSKVIVIKQKWHVYARPHHMLQTEEEVLDIVEDDPSTSTREIARQRSKVVSFINVKLNFPAVILLSRIDEWWNYIDDCDQLSIVSTLEEIHAGLPILTVASCREDIPTRLHNFFYNNSTILIRIEDPNEYERKAFLAPLFFEEAAISLLVVSQRINELRRKNIKCENDSKCHFTRARRKRDGVDYVTADVSNSVYSIINRKYKRKRDSSNHGLYKRLKLCESKYGAQRSNSTTSVYDIHKRIKTEKNADDGVPRQYASWSSFQSLKNKQYFTRVLSDLLNQKNGRWRDHGISKPNEDSACDKTIKTEPYDKPSVPNDTFYQKKY
ncbi:hypothetical protein NQ317_008902 [Molorchus minor]|uniref:AAA+ ATPase domain-containing protein n=1 Tax=Molorchus minor TaxID=1323400 RepID=A0ABQ9IX44_9CUCU|nr:hypothetical protein NQ317_008902 [Molorchus minor]